MHRKLPPALTRLMAFGLLCFGLTGAASANVVFFPTALDFGTTTVGTPVDRVLQIFNVSDEPVEFFASSPPSPYFLAVFPLFDIPPHPGSITITIRLPATSAGVFNDTYFLTFRGVNSGIYYYKQIALNGTVNAACSSSPAVSVTSPASGATVSPNGNGNVIINATATDSANGISRVEFYVDGVLKRTDLTAPYGYAWPAKSGSHQVYARAFNGCGNSTDSAPRSFTVDCGAPAVTLTQPADGTTVSPNAQGNVILKATASHSTGIDRVRFFIDGSLVATDQSAPFAYAWPASSGTYRASARAFSECGGPGVTSNRADFTVP